MRAASTYRGARRNAYVSPAARRSRLYGWNAWERANAVADLGRRSAQANAAREAAAKALVAAGPLASASIADHAFLDFYRTQPRTRVVNRIIRALVKQTHKAERKTAKRAA